MMKGKKLFSTVVCSKFLALSAFCIGATTFSGGAIASQIPDHIVIEKLWSCWPSPDRGPAHVIFDQYADTLWSWSHIYNDPDSFPGLAFDIEQYRMDSTNVVTDNQCWNLRVFKGILVKKYADWDLQHATGLVTEFPEQAITFGDIKDVVLEIKLNSNETFIPDKMSYLSTYGSYTDIANLLEMDQGKVNLGITLYGPNDADQSIETFQGMINLELDQTEFFDRWLRIVIPGETLWYFVQQNYANTEKALADYLAEQVIGLRINPETHNTNVLRNYIPDTFDDSVPESYKEMGVSIRKLEVRLKEDGPYWWGEKPH